MSKRKIELPEEVVAKFRRMLEEHPTSRRGGDEQLSPDAAGGMSMGGEERVPVRVVLTVGDEAVVALPHQEEDLPRFSSAWLAEQVGVDVTDLPGLKLTAVVVDGELVGFEAA